MGQFSLAKLFGITMRESANDGSDFTNPDADFRRVFLGEDGALHAKDSSGTVTTIGGGSAPTNNIIVDIATPIKRTAGNITANSTTWTELAAETGGPGTGGFDLDFTGCAAGDILEVNLSYYANNAATYFYVDFATIVSSSPVNYIGSGQVTSSTGDGVSGLAAIASREETKAGTVRYAIVSGDLSAGALKVRPYFRTSSATDRTIFAVTADPLHLSGIVFRP